MFIFYLFEALFDLHNFVVLMLRFYFSLFEHGNHVKTNLYLLVLGKTIFHHFCGHVGYVVDLVGCRLLELLKPV